MSTRVSGVRGYSWAFSDRDIIFTRPLLYPFQYYETHPGQARDVSNLGKVKHLARRIHQDGLVRGQLVAPRHQVPENRVLGWIALAACVLGDEKIMTADVALRRVGLGIPERGDVR